MGFCKRKCKLDGSQPGVFGLVTGGALDDLWRAFIEGISPEVTAGSEDL